MGNGASIPPARANLSSCSGDELDDFQPSDKYSTHQGPAIARTNRSRYEGKGCQKSTLENAGSQQQCRGSQSETLRFRNVTPSHLHTSHSASAKLNGQGLGARSPEGAAGPAEALAMKEEVRKKDALLEACRAEVQEMKGALMIKDTEILRLRAEINKVI